MATRRELRSYDPKVKERLRLREELKKSALPTAAYCRLSSIDRGEGVCPRILDAFERGQRGG